MLHAPQTARQAATSGSIAETGNPGGVHGRPLVPFTSQMKDELQTLAEATEWRSLLNIAEQRAVESAIRGEALDFAGDSQSDIRRAGDPLPVIRARVIEVLALGLRADWPVHRRGIRIGGARVEGELDLAMRVRSLGLVDRHPAARA
jgi:hypothetical protein